ncbi:2-C-methyl-D-erythritol 2,4-cyclodiphosphate synthase [Desulfolucanica intricata]|uniref:2-C-methyl-D-erythritol 2,4-cyclodiphosphate synthase n=1 Tax=Desulfolucanica intricata TaxID=1285191 RepID=UPI00082EC061|nr:2-C-methyl-D-erythritol 2,4-cyclodiphosphate synthase [Desulfolucanica intricata]
MRIGFGYDVHRLVENRPLVLGGVTVPYQFGLAGHSDADVLVHAIMDALLGAAGAGDIGRHFPDYDRKYKDISSLVLLDRVSEIILTRGYKVGNIDAVIVAQRPKLAGYIPKMVEKVATVLKLSPQQINIKATTTEGLGFTGTGEGIASYAVALLIS